MKHRQNHWMTQVLYLTPLTWAGLVGCQGWVASSFVALQPPVLVEASPVGLQESASTLGPGNQTPTPSRLAQPTGSSTLVDATASAAPGPSEARKAALGRTLLLQATASLEQKDFTSAARHLERYLLSFPDSALIRMQLAELWFQESRHDAARRQFLMALGEVADPPLPVHSKLHAHSRLVEIASENSDRFNEDLQRGIGLLVLAEHRRNQSSASAEVTPEELLGKARAALTRASKIAPQDARPWLYLAAVWNAMGQTSNARSAFLQSQHLAIGSYLTASEWMQLAMWSVEWR
ncbi:MAG TPA: tetratricopeptide repeat protein [Gemmatales bacterium]|nr:tetratricopeptide repeat protein [Gemmatales bacterium]